MSAREREEEKGNCAGAEENWEIWGWARSEKINWGRKEGKEEEKIWVVGATGAMQCAWMSGADARATTPTLTACQSRGQKSWDGKLSPVARRTWHGL